MAVMNHESITYVVTPDDFGRWHLREFMSARSDQLLRRTRRTRIFTDVFLAICTPLAVLGARSLLHDATALGFGAPSVVMVCLVAVTILVMTLPANLSLSKIRRLALSTYVQTLERPPGFAATGQQRLEITPEGLVSESCGSSSLTKWGWIDKIEVNDEYVTISTHTQHCWLIPRGAATDQAGVDAFVEAVRSRLISDSVRQRIIAFAETGDFTCSRCGAHLGQHHDGRCPACGNEVTMESLLAPWKNAGVLARRLRAGR